MGLDPNPPPLRSPIDNHATLLVSWWCTLCAFVIILFRVMGRLARTGVLLSEDKYMCWAIIPLFIRMALVHVVLLYGTNNTTTEGLTPMEIQHRSIGSRLVLGSRIFYALFIWMCKLTVSEFLKRLTTSTWNRRSEVVLISIRVFLLATFIGVVIGTLSECQPFDHFWQVVPDPGPQCRSGYVQLFCMGISDIITDIVLIVFPAVVIFRSNMPMRRRISTTMLYSLSAFLIAIAAYRIVAIVDVQGRQQRRSLWASIEILASAAATNAVIIGSYVRDKGVKKQKYKTNRAYGMPSSDNLPSINRQLTREHWGNDSDEDLFREVARGRMDSIATQGTTNPFAPRTPVAVYAMSPFHAKYTDDEDEIYRDEDTPAKSYSNLPVSGHASEGLTLGDAGGLAGPSTKDDSPAINAFEMPRNSEAVDFAAVRPSEELEDISEPPETNRHRRLSALATLIPTITQRPSLPPNGRPTAPGDELEIHDPGGLLE